jgi:hypothetical protein
LEVKFFLGYYRIEPPEVQIDGGDSIRDGLTPG